MAKMSKGGKSKKIGALQTPYKGTTCKMGK